MTFLSLYIYLFTVTEEINNSETDLFCTNLILFARQEMLKYPLLIGYVLCLGFAELKLTLINDFCLLS